LVRKLFDHLVEWICAALMIVLCADIFLGVFSRYVMGQTFTWYDEIARACFVWVVFLGTAVGVKRHSHFRLHLAVSRFSRRTQDVAELLAVLAIVGFAGILVWQGWRLTEFGLMQQTPVMGLSKSWIYAAIPVGSALMIFYAMPALWHAAQRVVGGRADETDGQSAT
jgi:TRAP-type C4-dicarboxylate transport system permease small subunit